MFECIIGLANVVITTPLWVANTRLRLQGIKWKSGTSGARDTSVVSTHYTGLLGEEDGLTVIKQQLLFFATFIS